jgi:hypothetical protein
MASPAIMYSCRDSRRDEKKKRGEKTRRKDEEKRRGEKTRRKARIGG